MKVFLSYTKSEAELANRLSGDFRRMGIDCAPSWETLSAGADVSDWLSNAVAGSDAVVVLVSKDYDGNRWAEEELSMAIYQQSKGRVKQILPVLAEKGAAIPALLEGLPFLRAHDNSYETVLSTLSQSLLRADGLGAVRVAPIPSPHLLSQLGPGVANGLAERAAALRHERRLFLDSRRSREGLLPVTVAVAANLSVLLGVSVIWSSKDLSGDLFLQLVSSILGCGLAFVFGFWFRAQSVSSRENQGSVHPGIRGDD